MVEGVDTECFKGGTKSAMGERDYGGGTRVVPLRNAIKEFPTYTLPQMEGNLVQKSVFIPSVKPHTENHTDVLTYIIYRRFQKSGILKTNRKLPGNLPVSCLFSGIFQNVGFISGNLENAGLLK